MHIGGGTLRPNNGDIERTCEWWKGLFGISGTEGFENGEAVSRMDGENSVLIIRHTFDNLAHEERVFDAWTVGEVHKVIQGGFNFEVHNIFSRFSGLKDLLWG